MNPYAQKSGVINQVSSKHEPPEPCRTLPKPTPIEALALKIKLPWTDKVRRMQPHELTKELFIQLDEYGLTRTEIMNLFHCYQYDFYPLLKKWGIPPATPGGKKKALRSGNFEPMTPSEKPPMDLSRSYHDTAPGKAMAARLANGPDEEIDQAIRTEKELDAELERIEKRLAEMGCKPDENYSENNSPKPAEIIPDPVMSTASTNEHPISTNKQKIDTPVVLPIPAEDEDGLNYQDRHNLGIHAPTAEEIADVFRSEETLPVSSLPTEPIFDFSSWETFDLNKIPIRTRSLIVGAKKLYVGVDVKFIKDWERCCVKVRPDGKQLALERTKSTGYKVGRDHQRPAVTCRHASEKITALIGTGAEFVPIIEQENLLVFEYRGKQ